jgi:protein TonB
MKKQETSTPKMDEIVFEKRNKNYGAYILRKMYNKQVSKALLLSVAILIAGLAYPVVSTYYAKNGGKYIWTETGVEIMRTDKAPVEPPVIPPAPPDASEIQNQVRFVPPQIVEGEVPDDGFLPMDELNKISKNILIDVSPEIEAEKQPDIIAEPIEKQETFITAEEMPSYPGGNAERQKFLAEAIQYPSQAVENGIQGTVYVQFVIDSKGNITEVKIMRGIGGGCDEEALRVIKMMPQWHPGKQNGKSVRVLYNMPVSFKLNS